jgi:hypothetical protein
MKFLVRNLRKHRVARNCRVYVIALHQISNNRVVSDDQKPDSAQLPWEGGDLEPRDIPYGASQYADIVHFSKRQPGWDFHAKPNYLNRDINLKGYRGTYRFSVIVACDGATPATKNINVDYNGDWKSARPYDALTEDVVDPTSIWRTIDLEPCREDEFLVRCEQVHRRSVDTVIRHLLRLCR